MDNHYSIIYYVRNNNSLTHIFTPKVLNSTIKAFFEIKKFLVENNINLEEDPNIKNIYGRFYTKWDATKEEEYKIFDNIRVYRNKYYYDTNLIIFHKIIDKLLSKKHYSLLYYYHKISVKILKNKLSKPILRKITDKMEDKIKIEKNNPLYEKINDKINN